MPVDVKVVEEGPVPVEAEHGVIDLGVTKDLAGFPSDVLAGALAWLDADPRIRWSFFDIADSDALTDFDAIISWQPHWTRDELMKADRLVLLARWGVGTDNVDLTQCTAQGVMCTITPNGVRRPVASANVAMILAATSKLLTRHVETSRGAWQDGVMRSPGIGLEGRVVGSIGLGRVATETFALLKPFGARFAAYSPTTPASRATPLGVDLVGLDDLLRRSDVLMINAPLTDRTTKLIGAREFSFLKPGSYFVNLGRGAIIDECALIDALDSGHLAGAALDVFEDEPLSARHPLVGRDNVILTPHMIAYTDDLFARMAADHRVDVEALFAGARPPNVVNSDVFDSPALAVKLDVLRRRIPDPQSR